MGGVIPPAHFTLGETHATFQPVGEMTWDRWVDLMEEAVSFARQQRVTKLLIDSSGVTGFEPPNNYQRFQFATRQAGAAAGSGMAIVIVTRAEMIHPERFGMQIAYHRGLMTNIFSTTEEALAWLHKPSPPLPPPDAGRRRLFG